MSWTTAGLQPTTGYYSPYDPTLAAYGWVEIIWKLRSHSWWNIKRADEQRNGLLPTKGVDNRRIAAYHVINFIAIFWIETCSLGRARKAHELFKSIHRFALRNVGSLWIEIFEGKLFICRTSDYIARYLCSTRQLFPRKPLSHNRKFRENNGKFLSLNRDKGNKKKRQKPEGNNRDSVDEFCSAAIRNSLNSFSSCVTRRVYKRNHIEESMPSSFSFPPSNWFPVAVEGHKSKSLKRFVVDFSRVFRGATASCYRFRTSFERRWPTK